MPNVVAVPPKRAVLLDFGLRCTQINSVNVDLNWPIAAAKLAAGEIKTIDATPAPASGAPSSVIIGRSVEANVGSPTSPGDPANAKTQLFIGPPEGKLWRVKSLRSVYTCDGSLGERTLVASFTSAAVGDVWSMAGGTVAEANDIIEVSGGVGGCPGQVERGPANGGENLSQVVNFSWPDMWISFDVTFRVWLFFGTGAADTFSDANFFVEERDA